MGAAGSSPVFTFSSAAASSALGAPSTSRERVAAGVMGGECIDDGPGLGDGRSEELRVSYLLGSREVSSCELT